ncbi:hypothetical protein CDAR_470981 [Caerostris darwini]|uniref:Uncharacterized protein n=1 Tax=Caerostris darwini TaxID=1538125 RepID=A0AAV4WA94_9ARAC|nr:hypothetical protein CDAR_470981 [Caerostris darwini]
MKVQASLNALQPTLTQNRFPANQGASVLWQNKKLPAMGVSLVKVHNTRCDRNFHRYALIFETIALSFLVSPQKAAIFVCINNNQNGQITSLWCYHCRPSSSWSERCGTRN